MTLEFDARQVVLIKELLECALEGLHEELEIYDQEEKEELLRECVEIENLLLSLGGVAV